MGIYRTINDCLHRGFSYMKTIYYIVLNTL